MSAVVIMPIDVPIGPGTQPFACAVDDYPDGARVVNAFVITQTSSKVTEGTPLEKRRHFCRLVLEHAVGVGTHKQEMIVLPAGVPVDTETETPPTDVHPYGGNARLRYVTSVRHPETDGVPVAIYFVDHEIYTVGGRPQGAPLKVV